MMKRVTNQIWILMHVMIVGLMFSQPVGATCKMTCCQKAKALQTQKQHCHQKTQKKSTDHLAANPTNQTRSDKCKISFCKTTEILLIEPEILKKPLPLYTPVLWTFNKVNRLPTWQVFIFKNRLFAKHLPVYLENQTFLI